MIQADNLLIYKTAANVSLSVDQRTMLRDILFFYKSLAVDNVSFSNACFLFLYVPNHFLPR